MPDHHAQPGIGELTGVFEVIREIEEIGARVGDRLVLRPWNTPGAVSLVRRLAHSDSRWAFNPGSAILERTTPPTPLPLAHRRLRDALGLETVSTRDYVPPTPTRGPLHLVP